MQRNDAIRVDKPVASSPAVAPQHHRPPVSRCLSETTIRLALFSVNSPDINFNNKRDGPKYRATMARPRASGPRRGFHPAGIADLPGPPPSGLQRRKYLVYAA